MGKQPFSQPMIEVSAGSGRRYPPEPMHDLRRRPRWNRDVVTRPLVAASLCVWTVLATQHTRGAEFKATDSGAVADGGSRPSEPRLAALPPIDFNLEQDDYASEPVSDADPEPAAVRPGRRGEFGASAPFSMGGFWAPPTRVSGQNATFGMNAEFARLGIPLGIPAEDRPLSVGIAKFGRLELATDARLPDSGEAVPDQLWLVEAGVMHLRPLDGSLPGGGTLGGTFLFGSASDRPFAAGRDLTLMAIAFYNRPAANARDEWNFSLFYSPTSQLPYPLPGIAYAWRPDPSFEAKLGVPAAVEWRPDDDWTLSVNWFPLVNVNATARRRLGENTSFVAFYRTDTQIYFLADRVRDDERFYVFDQRAAAGFERTLGGGFSFEILASYLFDRTLFQGTSFSSGRTDVVTFEPGLGLSAQVLWRR